MSEGTNDPALTAAVAAFLYAEADLLDEWRLPEWEMLLRDDARYLVPPMGLDGAIDMEPDAAMFIVSDDRSMLAERVKRLLGRHAYAELPRSRLRHMITNVQLLSTTPDELIASANMVLHRIRRGEVTTFIGKYRHHLARTADGFQIVEKRVALDIDVLRGQGGISIIL